MSVYLRFTAVAAFTCLCLAASVQAQTLSETRPLSFGTFAVANNNMPAAITVTPDNDVFADSNIVVGDGAQCGEYVLTGLPPNVSFYLGVDVPNPPSEGGVVVADPTLATGGGGEVFTLDNLTIDNGGILQSDGAGDARMCIGATLRTSGSGGNYAGGLYSGTYRLTIYY